MKSGEELDSPAWAELSGLEAMERVFDDIPDTAFFVKDRAGRYVIVNRTLVARCGVAGKGALLGRRADEVFPAPLGESYRMQDEAVLRSARGMRDKLELHLYPGGGRGWCLTFKEVIRDVSGAVRGLCGISRDLRRGVEKSDELAAVSQVVAHIGANYSEPLRVAELAASCGMSGYQFDQRIRELFGVTPGQYLVRVRIEAACERLATTEDSIVDIALACGYGDQSAFSRQFKQVAGLTPAAYRKREFGLLQEGANSG